MGAHKLKAQALGIIADGAKLIADGLSLYARAAHDEEQEGPVAEAASAQPFALVKKRQLAQLLGVSDAHIDRLNPPCVIVGDASTKRYDLPQVLAWLAARKPAPTTPAAKATIAGDDVNVSDALQRAGLRAIGGGRAR
jgi:hypothetical protein